jgi:hypothetical protein
MTSQNSPSRPQLLGLIDAAAFPARIQPLLDQSETTYQSVFAGLPEEVLGPASLFLVRIDDPEATWAAELDQIDLNSPCMSLIWSRVSLDDMVTHLRSFLYADIGDGMRGMVRFYDPRNIGAIVKVWGDQIRNIFMAPIDRWLYRGRHEEWQRIENDALFGRRICKSITIQLEQADLDALTAHTEPDELLASLIQLGLVDEARPYLARFADFLPRYQRALQWGLMEPSDRLNFCRHAYLYGLDFDRHLRVHHALSERATTGESYLAVTGRIPSHVWEDLARRHDMRVNAGSTTADAGAAR